MVLMAAAVVAAAMLAVCAAAWAQGTTGQAAAGGSVGVAGAGDPKITPKNPKPGEKISDRTPTIKAKVSDKDPELKKKDIKLWLDKDKITNFTYNEGKDLLKYTPKNNLSKDKHTVKIQAGPQGDRATRSWSFTIKS
jgi:hypothetical protein